MTAQDWLEFLHDLAGLGDDIARAYFRRGDLAIDLKDDATPVTQADRDIERTLREAAVARHPHLGFLGEEYGTTATGDTRLVIDPIDATANFARGIPLFATLLAIEQAGEIVAGVVSASALRTRWSAARGCGAYRDGERIRVSRVARIEEAQIFHGGLAGAESVARLPGFVQLMAASKRQRGFGDFYQHVLVAEGAGEIAIDRGLAAWDVAALTVIVEEAGGRATSLDGRRDIHAGSLVTGNAMLHDHALALLRAPQA